jgi:hypothetical protein
LGFGNPTKNPTHLNAGKISFSSPISVRFVGKNDATVEVQNVLTGAFYSLSDC